MSEDPIERIFMERATLREIGADMSNYRPTQTGYEPVSPVPENLPILGGNEIQGYPAEEADTAERTMEFNPSDGLVGSMQMLSEGFGAGIQQYELNEVEKRIADKTLTPLDHIQAVVENPDVPLGDYYDASTNTFSNVPSDDYILHQGQLYPRVTTDAEGNQVDLSQDNMMINYGRMLMDSMLDPLEGVGVGTRAAAQLIKGGAPDPNTLGSGIVPGATTGAQTADDVSDIGFYSEVSRAVDALPMDKGSASQMRAMIAKTPGVKPEEMAWIGLDDFLKGKKSVTKAEVQEYVQANQVQLEEVVRADEGVEQEISYLKRRYEMMVNGEGDYAQMPPSLREERASVMLDNIEAMEADRVVGRPKFASYTLPGGENYREVLLTLPETRAYDGERYLELQRKDFDGKLNDPDEVAEFYRLADAAKDARKNKFTGGHFEESNVLAHMRLNDRTGPNGERILFIEEIQSDWHQKGRDKGYQQGPSKLDEELISVENQLDELAPKSRANFDYVNSGGDRSQLPYPNIGHDIEILSDRRSEIVADLARLKDGVPDAPLKKTWHEMSFRRVARMAAEEGYDAIAWTPGKMQAERYNLSKQVDALEYTPLENGQYKIEITDSDLAEVTLPNDGIFEASDLANYVGKEIADKIVSGEGKKLLGRERATDFRYLLKGIDLQVGGEGMKGFYDQMLKTYAAKWGKKFGAKVGVSGINTETKFAESIVPRVSDENMVDVAKALAEKRGKVWENLSGEDRLSIIDDALLLSDEELNLLNIPKPATKLEGGEKVWTLPVTKKMRDSIMSKGIPTFAVGGAVALSQVERDQNGN